MAYSTTVDVIDMEGGSYPSIMARLWMLWMVVGTGSGTGPQQQPQEDLTIQTTASNTALSFNQGPDNSYSSRQIGLSIQDSSRVASNTGWWFRSGRMETLPTQSIEVILANRVDMTQADVDASLPPMPMSVDATTTITSATAMLQNNGFISLVANGTTSTSPLPAPVNFTYTLEFKIVPSASIADAETEVFDIETQGRGTIVFTGTTVVGTIEAAILNTISFFILRELFPRFRARLKSSLNTSVLSQLAGRIAPGTTTMPPGIIVSARTVAITSQGIAVRAALGAFGGVLSKFPTTSTGGGKICGILALGASTAAAIQPDMFRMFRDNILARSNAGKELIELYYKHSEEAVKIVLSSYGLSGRAARLLLELQQQMRSNKPMDKSFVNSCDQFLQDIGNKGSEEFRLGIAAAKSIVERNNYFGLAATNVQ